MYENELITQEQAAATAKARLENENLNKQAKIDAYKAYEGKDKSELEAEVEGLSVTHSAAKMDYLQAQQVALTAQESYNEVCKAFNPYNEEATLKTLLAVKALRTELSFYGIIEEDFIIDEKLNLTVTRYSLESEESVVTKRQELTSIEKTAKATLGAKKVGETPASGLYADLETAEKSLADAVAAKDEALIDQYTLKVAQCNDQIAGTLKSIENAAQNLKDFEAAIASFAGEDLKAYDAALAALKENEAVVAYINAKAEETKLEKAKIKAEANWEAAKDLADNGVNAKEQILTLEDEIATNLKDIANLAEEPNETDYLLQLAKTNVTRYTTLIETQETVVELAKKNLDAAIAAQAE